MYFLYYNANLKRKGSKSNFFNNRLFSKFILGYTRQTFYVEIEFGWSINKENIENEKVLLKIIIYKIKPIVS